MNFLVCTILLALTVSVYAAADVEQKVSNVLRMPPGRREELIRKLKTAGDCNPNICFALDGSEAITDSQFTTQKDFVKLVTAIIGGSADPQAEFAAVQYSSSSSPISPLTTDASDFLLKVDAVQQLKGKSCEGCGIKYCTSQLRRRKGDANKIVLLGDGIKNKGPNPVKKANKFRQKGGEVYVVAVGSADNEALLAIAGGDPNKVFQPAGWPDLLRRIEEFIVEVCGVNP